MNKENSHNSHLNSKKILSVLNKKLEKANFIKTFEDLKMFNDIKTLANSSKIDLDLSLYGLSVAIPAIKEFINFKDGTDIDEVNDLLKQPITRSLFITNTKVNVKNNGINALEIIYMSINKKFEWNKDFEEFLRTKEIKITKWINPIEQLVNCIILSKIFDCYFDEEHYIKSAATILFMDDSLLKKFCIERSKFNNQQNIFLEKNLKKDIYKNIFSGFIGQKEYKFKKNKGYPYLVPFAKSLPEVLNKHLIKAIDLYSLKTKKDFLTKFKKGNYLLKLLMITFDKKDIPVSIQEDFKKLYKNFTDKELLINCELNDMSYDEFEKAIINYRKITKNLHSNLSSAKLLYQRNLFKELINFKENSPGPIVKATMGYIPDKNNFLKDPIEFKNYEVSQVKSRLELISVGHEFGNCLRHTREYHHALNRSGVCFFVFRFKSRKRNYASFIAYTNLNNRQCAIYEMHRRSNGTCSQEERILVQELLMNMKLIDIPDEYFAHFTMQTFTEIASKNFENGINGIIENAPMIYTLLNKLRASRQWFYNVDNQLLTDDQKKIVKDFLQKENNINVFAP